MSEVYPDSIKLEMQFAGTAGAWTDITEDIVRSTPITCTYGIQDSSPLARVASTGTFNFVLDNSELNSAGLVGYYSPGHTNCRSGFKSGITVRFSVIFGDVTYPKFYGRIPATGIQIIPGSNKERQTMVEVRDFMEQCAIHEIDSPDFVQSKTAAELIQLILAEQSIQPLATEYNTCEDTFFSAFENQNEKLNCLVEISKACTSEFGYAYVRHDVDNYEKFVVEGRKTRTGITSSKVITVANPILMCDYLLKEDGGRFQLEDESGYIKLDCSTTGTASYVNSQYDAVIQNGNDLYNSIEVNSINKSIGTAEPVKIWASSYTDKINKLLNIATIDGTAYFVGSLALSGEYSVPSASNIKSIGLVSPVAPTDFTIGTNADYYSSMFVSDIGGSSVVGTLNIKAMRTAGTAETYWASITKLQVRGTPLFQEDISQNFNGTVSIDSFGKSTLTIDMPHQSGTSIPASIAETLLTQYQDPETRTENVLFYANKDINIFSAFLVLDIGDRFTYQETVSGINEDYFINGVTFEIYANNVIKFGYKTKQASLEVF
jgi:hypothetical protein